MTPASLSACLCRSPVRPPGSLSAAHPLLHAPRTSPAGTVVTAALTDQPRAPTRVLTCPRGGQKPALTEHLHKEPVKPDRKVIRANPGHCARENHGDASTEGRCCSFLTGAHHPARTAMRGSHRPNPGAQGQAGTVQAVLALGTEQLSRAFTRRQAGKVERALQGRPSTKVPAGAQRGRQRHSEDGTRSQNEARGQRSPQSLNWGGGQRGRKVKVCRGSPCPPSAETLPLTHAAQGGSTAPCGFHVKELWQQNQQQRKEW